MSERHIELTWRCSSCAHRNLGRHMVCQGCGNPIDRSESYEMPSDTAAATSVEDPALVRMAEAGANWSCAYCGSNQRDLDGDCQRCGADRRERANAVDTALARAELGAEAPAFRRRFGPWHYALAAAAGLALVLVPCAFAGVFDAKPKAARIPAPLPLSTPIVLDYDCDAVVTAVSWSRSVTVERYQLAPHEAFTDEVPSSAVDLRPSGQRVHHEDEVFDHDETVYDAVEVPDGYRTETYSEREACGEDCSTTPRRCRDVCTRTRRSCREVCKDKKNGFASCREVCTGGDESCRQQCTGGDRECTTRYCNRTKTRSVPKTRIERRPRIEKRYRSVPRYAAWSTYKTWEWVPVRTAEGSGSNASPQWPDAGVAQKPLGAEAAPKPGAERERPSERLSATITTERGLAVTYTPASAEELARLAPGAKLRVRVSGDELTLL